jgi:hypothetical protein
MRKRNLVIIICLALVLVACKSSTSAEPTATEIPPEPTQVPEPTSIPVSATRPPATCTVVSMRPEDQENQELLNTVIINDHTAVLWRPCWRSYSKIFRKY